MKNSKPFRARALASLALAAALVVSVGCEGDGDNPYAAKLSGNASSSSASASSPSESSSSSPAATSADIVGTWALTGAGKTWYGHFAADGSWKITNDKAGHERRVYGTYTAKNGSFSGPMVNPGTGEGDIQGTYSGTSMELDFTEYWHTPHKVIRYNGTKQ